MASFGLVLSSSKMTLMGLPFTPPFAFTSSTASSMPSFVSTPNCVSAPERLRKALVEASLSYCTETVFSDPVGAKLALLERARRRGFAVFLVFIGLDSPALSVARVKQRVEQGGHDIPDDRLHARFPRTLANLRAAVPLVDEAFLFDNSSSDAPYRMVAAYAGGKLVSQHPPLPAWTRGLPGLRG